MKLIDLNGQMKGEIELPQQFREEIREDLIKLAVLAIQSHRRQPYGSDPEAGKKSSAELSRRRRSYRGSYGFGISRVPRKILSRRGRRMNWVGAFAPGTVGGRRAHPPKAEKIWDKKINKKERRKAIRSALAASLIKELCLKRGHKLPDIYPFAVTSDIEALNKTKDVVESLKKMQLTEELQRISERKIRAGKGKSRGRKYKVKKGPLIVVSKECPLIKSASNILGVDVVEVKNINAELLAPGCTPGRLTIFTDKAIKELEENKLFL